MKATLSTQSPARTPIVVLLTAAALSAGLLLTRAGRDNAQTIAGSAPAPVVLDTQAQIDRLQLRLKTNPGSADDFAQLGWLMLQRARENGDPDLYSRAQAAFDGALKQDPNQVDALLGHGSLALSRHAFAEAIAWGGKARTLNPYRAQALGVIGDGQIELGQYDAAAQTIQKMVDLRPDIASYSRVSYLRELNGDMAGAIDAMSRAVVAGNPESEARAWAQTQLATLYFDQGDLRRAEREMQAVLAYRPNFAPGLAAFARVRAAQGRDAEALALYERALALLPTPETAQALGELQQRQGKGKDAAAQFDLARALFTLGENGGTDVSLERARFESAHGTPAAALTHARAAYAHRPNIHSADALAWALYLNGNFAEAARMSAEALRLGTQDAAMHFHAGAIAAAQGRTAAARAAFGRALAINPHFSAADAQRAREWLNANPQ